MERRLPAYRPGVKMISLSGWAIQWIGFAFVCLSSFSIAVLQRGVLGLGSEGSMEALDEAMKPGGNAMGWATLAVFCSLLSTLAIPIFAKLVYEGWKRAENSVGYFWGLAVCALISEVPYDFAMNGKLLDMSAQNPVWGMFFAAVMLEIVKRWNMKSAAANIAFRALMVFVAILWVLLLRVYMGFLLVLLIAVFHFAANRKTVTMLGGVLITLLQFPAPVGMLFVHWYDGEKRPSAEKLLAILYPVQLLVFGLLALLFGK